MTQPIAPRTGAAAIEWARASVGGHMPDDGLCLQYTRQIFEIPAVYGSAGDAGRACNVPHPYDRNPPPGVPLWFWTPSQYDHICFHADGDVISTFNDEIRSFSGIAAIESSFNGTYAGWGEDLNEERVYLATLPTPPDDEEDDMRPMFLQCKTGEIVIAQGEGVRGLTLDHWQVWQNLGYELTHADMDPGPFEAVIHDLGGRQ